MKSHRMNFFEKLIFSIVDAKLYPFVLNESIFSALGFFFKLILLFSFVISVMIFNNIVNTIPDYVSAIEKNTSNFELVGGRFTYTEPIDFKIDNMHFCTSKDKEFYMSGDFLLGVPNSRQNVLVLINETDADVYLKVENDMYFRFINISFGEMQNINKQQIVSTLNDISESYLTRLITMLGIMTILFITYGIRRIWILVFYMISIFIMNFIFFNKLRFRDYLKIAIYVSGLPVLLEMISYLIAKTIPDSAMLVLISISTFYIYYALRTIKIERIMLSAVGDTPEEKIINAITKAQEELQKQIDELEREKEQQEEPEQHDNDKEQQGKDKPEESNKEEQESNEENKEQDDNK